MTGHTLRSAPASRNLAAVSKFENTRMCYWLDISVSRKQRANSYQEDQKACTSIMTENTPIKVRSTTEYEVGFG